MKFLDTCKITVRGGDGGAGSLSFRREKFVPRGGPDGGDGGRGGDVIAQGAPALNTLIDYRYRQHFVAAAGKRGAGKNRSGAGGKDRVLLLPLGTQIFNEDQSQLLADITKLGERVVLARGGVGGLGNARFKSSRNQAPRRTVPGGVGEEQRLFLQLKLIADVGLLGLPNAGKSTLLSVISNARPKIADYPFTTLHPQLGLVESVEPPFVVADIPGLIAGAHQGTGLGDRFLGHVERCRAFLHLVDGSGEDAAKQWRIVRRELRAYRPALARKPELIALSKCDLLDEATQTRQRRALARATSAPVFNISAVKKDGVQQLLHALRVHVDDTTGEAVSA